MSEFTPTAPESDAPMTPGAVGTIVAIDLTDDSHKAIEAVDRSTEVLISAGGSEPPTDDAPDAKTLAATMRGELDAVEAALVRLDDETYGLCSSCGEQIADDLLAQQPTATLCGQHA